MLQSRRYPMTVFVLACIMKSSGTPMSHGTVLGRQRQIHFHDKENATPVALYWLAFLLQLQMFLFGVTCEDYTEVFREREKRARGGIVSSQRGLATQHWSMSGSGYYCRGWERGREKESKRGWARERKRKRWWEKLQHSKYLTLPERVFLSSPQLYCVSILLSQR